MVAVDIDRGRGWIYWFINLPRWAKRIVVVLADFLTLSFILWASMSLRLSVFYSPYVYAPGKIEFELLLALAPVIGVLVFFVAGLYRLVTRYISYQGTVRIFAAVSVAVLLWALAIFLSGIESVPRSVVIIYGLLAAFSVSASRQVAGWALRGVPHIPLARFTPELPKVVIYGAGATGVQLLQALQRTGQYRIVGLIDENSTLWGQIIRGVKVYRPNKITTLVQRERICSVFLAIPEAPRHKRQSVIRSLEPFPVVVKTLPAIEDIASGQVEVADLRPVDVDDLLGRDAVPPDAGLLKRTILGKCVLVTGAGGSIGSELSRQVLKQKPRKLILLEQSEVALYEIESELHQIQSNLSECNGQIGGPEAETELAAVLGSVNDEAFVRQVLTADHIDTIFHTAAYKHVPIVELNPVAGLQNNTFGTGVIAEAARGNGVERFVLVSTDKAVRPTNIMGASKRLAELILQAHASEPDCGTIFTMVRFGNVLDSSGSVVRRFRQQIQNGGPITITHRDIVRYFMSIPEAAELVIQAGAMAEGGDVFVLDMGKPVRIEDLARSMIRLMGLQIRDEQTPNGDIAIKYIGLRKGEKLYEELLIGENTVGTNHSRILKSSEPYLPMYQLKQELLELCSAMKLGDIPAIIQCLNRSVEGYRPDQMHLAALPSVPEEWVTPSRTIH